MPRRRAKLCLPTRHLEDKRMRYRRATIFDLRHMLCMEAIIARHFRTRRTPRRVQGRVSFQDGIMDGSTGLVLPSYGGYERRPEPRGTSVIAEV